MTNVALLVSEEEFTLISEVNRRGSYALFPIPRAGMETLITQIERDSELYEIIVLSIGGIKNGTVDLLFDFADRLTKTMSLPLVVLFPEALATEVHLNDFALLGCTTVTSTGVMLKREITEVLLKLSTQAENPFSEIESTEELNLFDGLPIDSTDNSNLSNSIGLEIQEAETPTVFQPKEDNRPPSAIGRVEGKKYQLPKPHIAEPGKKAFTIAIAGTGPRIGTTTQAMQLMMFLEANGYSAALIESNDEPIISEFITEDTVLIDSDHYIFNNLNFYRNRNAILKAKTEFQYLILDYGDFSKIPEKTAFLDKDLNIICTGAKPSETKHLAPVFDLNDDSLTYIFSFIAKNEERDIKEQMVDSKLFFAPYTPDYFSYSGQDELYMEILSVDRKEDVEANKGGFFSRLKRGN